MASWGSGPYENDAGLGYLASITQRLVEQIRVAAETQASGDSLDEAVAAVNILITLVRKKLPVVLPSPQECASWQEALLVALDDDKPRRRAAKRDADAVTNAATKAVDAGEDTLLPVGRLSGLVARTARREAGDELVDAVALGNWIGEQGDALDTVWKKVERADWLLVVAAAAGVESRLLVPGVISLVKPLVADIGEEALDDALLAAEAWSTDPGVTAAAACGASRHHAAHLARTLKNRGDTVNAAIASAVTAVGDAADAGAAGEEQMALERLIYGVSQVARVAELKAKDDPLAGTPDEAHEAALTGATDTLRGAIDWNSVQSAYAESLGHDGDTKRVVHPKFGEGLIVREIPGRVMKLEVDFGARGRKILAKAFFDRLAAG